MKEDALQGAQWACNLFLDQARTQTLIDQASTHKLQSSTNKDTTAHTRPAAILLWTAPLCSLPGVTGGKAHHATPQHQKINTKNQHTPMQISAHTNTRGRTVPDAEMPLGSRAGCFQCSSNAHSINSHLAHSPWQQAAAVWLSKAAASHETDSVSEAQQRLLHT